MAKKVTASAVPIRTVPHPVTPDLSKVWITDASRTHDELVAISPNDFGRTVIVEGQLYEHIDERPDPDDSTNIVWRFAPVNGR